MTTGLSMSYPSKPANACIVSPFNKEGFKQVVDYYYTVELLSPLKKQLQLVFERNEPLSLNSLKLQNKVPNIVLSEILVDYVSPFGGKPRSLISLEIKTGIVDVEITTHNNLAKLSSRLFVDNPKTLGILLVLDQEERLTYDRLLSYGFNEKDEFYLVSSLRKIGLVHVNGDLISLTPAGQRIVCKFRERYGKNVGDVE